MENIKFAIEYLKNNSYKMAEENNNYAVQSANLAIEALEKQAFFENEVSNIHSWFVDNKDELLNSAMKVARNGFIESCVDDFIDQMDLYFIVEDIVDEIQKGILNVLATYND